MKQRDKFFEWNDAWVFVALFGYGNSYQPIDLHKIVASGDVVNRAVFAPEELRNGLVKLSLKGLIETSGPNIRFSKEGIRIKEVVQKDRGGLFAYVDNALRRLNASTLKLAVAKEEIPMDYFSDEEINRALKDYIQNPFNKTT